MDLNGIKLYIFFQKKIWFYKKYVFLPYLKFSDPLPETHLFCYLALLIWVNEIQLCICLTVLVQEQPMGLVS